MILWLIVYEIEEQGNMRQARAILNKFADAYDLDKDIWEKDLQVLGPTKTLEKLEKIESNKKR